MLDEAVALAKSGQSDQALTTIDRALALDPDWIALYYIQAIIYSVKSLKYKEENSYNEVIRRTARASGRDKSRYQSAAYYNLAFIEADRSQIDQAFADLGEALRLVGEPSIYYHDLVSNRSLTALRSDGRFVPLMRRYWPQLTAARQGVSRSALLQTIPLNEHIKQVAVDVKLAVGMELYPRSMA